MLGAMRALVMRTFLLAAIAATAFGYFVADYASKPHLTNCRAEVVYPDGFPGQAVVTGKTVCW